MSKAITAIIVIVILVLIGYGIYYYAASPREKLEENATTTEETSIPTDITNATYYIEEMPITLTNGKSEVEITPGSASKQITIISGDPVIDDLDGEGDLDSALILTQTSGGSGTFYYITAALTMPVNASTTASTTPAIEVKGLNSFLLGDRITLQSVNIEDKVIVVNYLDREIDQPMTEEPSVSRVRYFKTENGMLTEITPDQETQAPENEDLP